MNLKEWIEKNAVNQSKMAEKMGSSRIYFNQVVNGHYIPGAKLANSIVEFTKGEVNFKDLYRLVSTENVTSK